jgi:hypothetical protein
MQMENRRQTRWRPSRQPMTLPQAAPQRQFKHRRQIDVQVYSRGDGHWEVDAALVDVKSRDAILAGDVRPAGTPIHDMLLRLVVDEQLNILEAGSATRWMPYPGQCDQHGREHGDEHGDACSRLVGLNLLQGFRGALRERVGDALGCTHLTELAQVLPTAVVQAFAGEVIDTRGDQASSAHRSRSTVATRCAAMVTPCARTTHAGTVRPQRPHQRPQIFRPTEDRPDENP